MPMEPTLSDNADEWNGQPAQPETSASPTYTCPRCLGPKGQYENVCEKCRQAIYEEARENRIHEQEARRKRWIRIAIVAVIVICLVVFLFRVLGHWSSAGSFQSVVSDCESEFTADEWDYHADDISLTDGGKTLVLNDVYDLAPQSDDLDYPQACIVRELNMPQSITEKMNRTRMVDGTLSDSWGKTKVTWSFDPDSGLDLIFERK